MIDILEMAPRAVYRSGKLDGDATLSNVATLPWNGQSSDTNGFAKLLAAARCEDGKNYNVLQMHPKWIADGFISCILPTVTLPAKAQFSAQIGFLHGATGSDGVTFEVWHHPVGLEKPVRRFSYHKKPGEALEPIKVDFSYADGMLAKIELRILAGTTSGKDWAVWANPKIDAGDQLGTASVWCFDPKMLTVVNRNETSLVRGRGDEPYLGAILFRSTFGKAGTTEVVVLDRMKQLGANVTGGVNIPIPAAAGLKQAMVVSADGVSIHTMILVAMEEDNRGEDHFRKALRDAGKKLRASLQLRVERERLGFLRMREVFEAVLADISPGGGSGLDKIKAFIGKVIVGLPRHDDLIDVNTLSVISGLSPELLGTAVSPTAPVNPSAGLAEADFYLDFKGAGAHYRVKVHIGKCKASDLFVG